MMVAMNMGRILGVRLTDNGPRALSLSNGYLLHSSLLQRPNIRILTTSKSNPTHTETCANAESHRTTEVDAFTRPATSH